MEIRKIRKHRRIRVNIETKIGIKGNTRELVSDMTDVSPGGCRLLLHQSARIDSGSLVPLTFNLPNEALVNELQATVVRVNHNKGGKKLELGCSFTGPSSETSKIINFCDFCMFFEVE